MKKLFLTFFILLPMACISQTIEEGSMWFDGIAQYKAEVRLGGKIVYFYGGTPHEGGFEFTMERTPTGKYKLIPSRQAEETTPVGEFGWSVEHVVRDGINALVVRDAQNEVSHVLSITGLSCYENMEYDNACIFLGTYSPNQVGFLGNGNEYIVDYKEFRAGESEPLGPYTFVAEYEMPINVVKSSGKLWMLVPTVLGMNVYPAKQTDDDMYEKAGDAISVFWSDPSKGRFSIASERLLNTSILGHYNREALRLMRNEILARHGYVFQSEDLSDYFFKQSWYTPAASNDGIKLSAMEEINIGLIKAEESKPDYLRYEIMEDNF